MSTIPSDRMLQLMSPRDRKSSGKVGKLASECQAVIEAKSEKQVQEQIANWLRLNGIPFHRARMDKKTTGTVGFPDFCFPHKGTFYGIEVKVGANKLSFEQEQCLAAIAAHRGIAAVVRSFEEFRRLLK